MKSKQYMETVYRSLCSNYGNLRKLYKGEYGSLRLAREIAHAYNDSIREGESYSSVLSTIQESYGYICVRFYDLKPCINAKQWVEESLKHINKPQEATQ